MRALREALSGAEIVSSHANVLEPEYIPTLLSHSRNSCSCGVWLFINKGKEGNAAGQTLHDTLTLSL
jgi:hypothetical protein